jgi:hypothetical protein
LATVRFGAHSGLKSDIAPCPKSAAITGSGALLFKDLIRASEKRRRDFETERFRCLEIDSKQEFGGLLDGKLGRFGIAASVRSADQMSEL